MVNQSALEEALLRFPFMLKQVQKHGGSRSPEALPFIISRYGPIVLEYRLILRDRRRPVASLAYRFDHTFPTVPLMPKPKQKHPGVPV